MSREDLKKLGKKVAREAKAPKIVEINQNKDGVQGAFLPDGVFDVPREDGDKVVPDDTAVLVVFSEDACVNGRKFVAGASYEIPKHLADSLHKVCSEVDVKQLGEG